MEFVDADRRELHFDRKQAYEIIEFLRDQMDDGAATFRLMLDVFPDCLDLTSYGDDGAELTHIHPRSEAFSKWP